MAVVGVQLTLATTPAGSCTVQRRLWTAAHDLRFPTNLEKMRVTVDGKSFDVGASSVDASTLLQQLHQSTQAGTPELACDAVAFEAWLAGTGESQQLTPATIVRIIEVRVQCVAVHSCEAHSLGSPLTWLATNLCQPAAKLAIL